MENNWQIVDDHTVIHSGNEDAMIAAFEYMTTPMQELIDRYPELDAGDLYESVKKWKRPAQGNLKLIEIHDIQPAS